MYKKKHVGTNTRRWRFVFCILFYYHTLPPSPCDHRLLWLVLTENLQDILLTPSCPPPPHLLRPQVLPLITLIHSHCKITRNSALNFLSAKGAKTTQQATDSGRLKGWTHEIFTLRFFRQELLWAPENHHKSFSHVPYNSLIFSRWVSRLKMWIN